MEKERCIWDAVMERNLTMGGEHTIKYVYDLSLNYILETYEILLINVTPIKNKSKSKVFKKKETFRREPKTWRLM